MLMYEPLQELYDHFKKIGHHEPLNDVLKVKKWISRYTFYKIDRDELVRRLITLKVPTLMLVELMDALDNEREQR